MPTAIPELIAAEIEARLNQILTLEDYAFDVTEVVRPTRRGENWQRKHLGIGVLQGDSVRVPENDHPGNPPAICYSVGFDLVGVIRDSVDEEDPKAVNENAMAAAIVKAITVPALTWHQFDGNAINAEIGDTQIALSSDGEFNAVTIPLRVIYRVSENDPYTVRA